MTSYLIDAVLIAALVFTSWRTGGMLRELRRLRSEESSFRTVLRESDAVINRAAHAVVMLKSEGIRTLQALEQRCEEARGLSGRLDGAIADAELRLALTRDADFAAPVAAPTQDNWLSLIESRLASASPVNR